MLSVRSCWKAIETLQVQTSFVGKDQHTLEKMMWPSLKVWARMVECSPMMTSSPISRNFKSMISRLSMTTPFPILAPCKQYLTLRDELLAWRSLQILEFFESALAPTNTVKSSSLCKGERSSQSMLPAALSVPCALEWLIIGVTTGVVTGNAILHPI
jgi:hypothetical protein